MRNPTEPNIVAFFVGDCRLVIFFFFPFPSFFPVLLFRVTMASSVIAAVTTETCYVTLQKRTVTREKALDSH